MKCIGGRGPIKHQLVEDDKTGDRSKWRARLTAAANQMAGAFPANTPLVVGYLALVDRPAAAARRLQPITRASGDVDKLARMALDSLDDADVYDDDSRVVLLLSAKAFADGPPGAIVYVAQAGPGVAETMLDAMLAAAPTLEVATA